MIQKINDFSFRISSNWLVKSIRRGLMYSVPFILAGSLALLFLNFPIESVKSFYDTNFGSYLYRLFSLIHNSTFNIIAIVILLCVSNEVALHDKTMKNSGLSPLFMEIIALACFFINLGMDITVEADTTGTGALFNAMVIAIIAPKLFSIFYRRKRLSFATYADVSDKAFYKMISTIFPIFLTMLIFVVFRIVSIRFGFANVGFRWAANALTKVGGLAAALIFNFLCNLMWFFGIHGNNVLGDINKAVFDPAGAINTELIASGLAPTKIVTKQFLDTFVFMGGCGSTLCLLIAMLVSGGRKQSHKFEKIAFFPALFNINEIMLFGLPVVLNPIFLIPFFVVPTVLILTSYFAMYIGIVPLVINQNLDWTSPIIIGGYQAVGSIAGSLLQIVNLVIGTFIYLPFVRMNTRFKEESSKKSFDAFIKGVLDHDDEFDNSLTELQGDYGILARTLTSRLEEAIKHREVNGLYLVYQPQVNINGELIGTEALLRWNDDIFGFVPPPVIVRLAEECGMINRLGDWIIEDSINTAQEFSDSGIYDIKMSINLSPMQICDGSFVDKVKEMIFKTNVNPCFLEFEIAEMTTINYKGDLKETLDKLISLGCRVAIDDFGMGRTSIEFIRYFNINTLKLDASLVIDIDSDSNAKEIVSSICNMCCSLKLDIIAEHIETREQRDILSSLGCEIYQGYYYSKPINKGEFLNYAHQKSPSYVK